MAETSGLSRGDLRALRRGPLIDGIRPRRDSCRSPSGLAESRFPIPEKIVQKLNTVDEYKYCLQYSFKI